MPQMPCPLSLVPPQGIPQTATQCPSTRRRHSNGGEARQAVTVSIPLVALLGAVVFVAWRYMKLRVWQAVLCLLFGFFLAATTEGVMPMSNAPRSIQRDDLQEIATRNRTARHIVAGLSAAFPTLADIWRYLDTALADSPALSAEIGHLRAELASARLDLANLAAAALATLTAHCDGEADPLSYLQDELHAQGFGARRGDT
jgi:hypothetical protein